MRWIFPNLFCGLLVLSLFVGCSPPKPTDDGSGPRAVPKGMMEPNKKGKPAMDARKMPPARPEPPGGVQGPAKRN